jgi:hypothetical protein
MPETPSAKEALILQQKIAYDSVKREAKIAIENSNTWRISYLLDDALVELASTGERKITYA